MQTILDQAHLSPLTINIQPTLSEYDHSLRLYPLPTAVSVNLMSPSSIKELPNSWYSRTNTTDIKRHIRDAMFLTLALLWATRSPFRRINPQRLTRRNGQSSKKYDDKQNLTPLQYTRCRSASVASKSVLLYALVLMVLES